VGALLLWNVNPSYGLPDAESWNRGLDRVPVRAALSLTLDETAGRCPQVLPIHHWLESWGDYAPAPGLLSLQQPVIAPLYDTRQAEDVLLQLAGATAASYRDFIRQRWQREVKPADAPVDFERLWNASLHDGVLARRAPDAPARSLDPAAVSRALGQLSGSGRDVAADDTQLELLLHPDSRLHDGRHANNGWLQELPEPVAKTVWGNALAVSVADARRLQLNDGDLVELKAGRAVVRQPVLIQPGQTPGVVSTALGYGRESGSVGSGVGVNAFPLMGGGPEASLWRPKASLTALAGERGGLVRTQEHHSMHGRDLARSTTLQDYRHHGLEHHSFHPEGDLFPKIEYTGHHWGMVIDMNTCTGCSACVIACQSENNIPVVGPEQVELGREMPWIRLDRYYEGEPDNPQVVHQPMLCQHCDKAPCENVCPVNATTHSDEGLNQMAYNRCVGTRYCANNCPYKVRRFNFFDFHKGLEEPQSLVYNPEVSLRPRGVMEKCSFCVQRIQDNKIRAKQEGRTLRDGDIRTACEAACPAQAIVFGDRNDPDSRVAKLWNNDRGYRVLEAELGIDPSIIYLAGLRNPAHDDDAGEDGHHE
jgi:molybdopterin-containing oxidoreductase family iron-sulfur binding subunit